MPDKVTKTHIFVGGPYDGRREMVPPGNHRHVLVFEHHPSDCTQHRYNSTQIATEEGFVQFWLHEKMTTHEALESLFVNYRVMEKEDA